MKMPAHVSRFVQIYSPTDFYRTVVFHIVQYCP